MTYLWQCYLYFLLTGATNEVNATVHVVVLKRLSSYSSSVMSSKARRPIVAVYKCFSKKTALLEEPFNEAGRMQGTLGGFIGASYYY